MGQVQLNRCGRGCASVRSAGLTQGAGNPSVNLLDQCCLKEHLGDSSVAFALQNSFHPLLDFPDFKEIFHVFGICHEENLY